MTDHVHDCTGPGAKCPCGYVFRVPPIHFSLEIFDGRKQLLEDHFNCNTVSGCIAALKQAISRLESL